MKLKTIFKNLFILAVVAVFTSACQDSKPSETEGTTAYTGAATDASAGLEGVVVSTMDAGNYTYVEIENNGQKSWAAGPSTEVKVGDRVSIPGGSLMQDFHSKSLDRTFESILFAGAIQIEGAGQAVGGQKAQTGAPSAAPAETETPEKGSITKAEGGYTVEEIFAKKSDLGGKTVNIRGKVIKANMGIMGKNWYHIQDGSGEAGTNDLLITSEDAAQAGDIVLAKGTLNLDRDLGSGYLFDVIVEETKITVE